MPSLYLDLTRAGVEFINEEKVNIHHFLFEKTNQNVKLYLLIKTK